MYNTETRKDVTLPLSLKEAVEEAAWKERISGNEFIRRTLAEKVGFSYEPIEK